MMGSIMPAPLISRDEVVSRLFTAFRTFGYEGATLARLSAATGLGRASLYHYFPDGKEGMVREVLDAARRWLLDNVKAPLERKAGSRASNLRAAMRALGAGYDNGQASCLVNLLGVGDAHDIARESLRETARIYLADFESFAQSCGLTRGAAHALAIDTVSQIEGALVMARALDDQAVFTKALDRIEKHYAQLS